jgi:hypothetical protein
MEFQALEQLVLKRPEQTECVLLAVMQTQLLSGHQSLRCQEFPATNKSVVSEQFEQISGLA